MPQELETPATATALFGDRLAEAVERKRSQLCVGLDPRLELLPVELRGEPSRGEAVERFCRGIVDAVCSYAREAGLVVIADGKRGDIGSTARAYAAAYLEADVGATPRADALTVNPYLGRESIEPYLAACRRQGAGILCIVKTSNAGADVQDVTLSDGGPLWHHVARQVADWGEELVGERGLSSVGAVVGATHPRAVAEARKLMPQSIFLLPGVGEQGASPADLARAFTSGPASAIVNASRSVIYAYRGGEQDWRSAAGAEAARLKQEIWAVSGW